MRGSIVICAEYYTYFPLKLAYFLSNWVYFNHIYKFSSLSMQKCEKLSVRKSKYVIQAFFFEVKRVISAKKNQFLVFSRKLVGTQIVAAIFPRQNSIAATILQNTTFPRFSWVSNRQANFAPNWLFCFQFFIVH